MAKTTVQPNNGENIVATKENKSIGKKIGKYKYFYIMFFPYLLFLFLFKYLPMPGIRYAFYKYTPFGAPKFVGLKNFETLFHKQAFWNAFNNTITLSLLNLFIGMFVSILFALLLNEIYNTKVKSAVQTVLYLPHFISWVVVASIFTIILSPVDGVVNAILVKMGMEPIFFLANEKWWTPVFIFVNRWKETGWGTIIYLAALSGINPELYEAAAIDGAGRLKQTWYVTIPGIMTTILTVFILNLAKVLNIFEPVFVMYNPMVYNVSDVIQTYVYRNGLASQLPDYGYTTAVGLFKSVISLILVVGANKLSAKIKGDGLL